MALGIHPFPARMAPEIALMGLKHLKRGAVVLDPMTGSGTVAKQALELGHSAHCLDLDPLAVLITKVSTTKVSDDDIAIASQRIFSEAPRLKASDINLPWIDGDEDTSRFIHYWFGKKQNKCLRQIAYVLAEPQRLGISEDIANVLRIALSRIIITKKQCASLAQDTSHSRPHKVVNESDYDVYDGYRKSLIKLRRVLSEALVNGTASVRLGDARHLHSIDSQTIDAIITSPPYLNAIDYLRGHRLSLVWMGYKFHDLSLARSNSIGSERRPDTPLDRSFFRI